MWNLEIIVTKKITSMNKLNENLIGKKCKSKI